MLYCRFKSGDVEGYGLVEQHEVWEIAPDYFSPFEKTGRSFPMSDVRFLPPTKPSKIIGVGLNYKGHISEFDRTAIPFEPVLFFKAPSAALGLNEPIRIAPGTAPVHYEAELGVVIGKTAHRIPEDRALDYVLGLTCFNDVTARALQEKDGQWCRSKSYDTFAPFGPWIADGLPPQELRLEAYLNGKIVQQGHTRDMIFSVAQLISFISGVMTLLPGDVISTGTPVGVGEVKAGDVVEIFVEGVGRLRNPVAAG